MVAQTFTSNSEEVILSCPACEHWQLHYSPAELVPGVFTSGKELEAIVEWLLKDHVAHECTQPRLFFILARSRGVV
jgi:hypothetical protein